MKWIMLVDENFNSTLTWFNLDVRAIACFLRQATSSSFPLIYATNAPKKSKNAEFVADFSKL